MRIAYLGSNWGTSLHRAEALKRIGHRVFLIDPRDYLPSSKWVGRWLYYTGGFGVNHLFDRPIVAKVQQIQPDLVWIAQLEYLGCGLLKKLQSISTGPIINYTNDDPFGGRDGPRFRKYLQTVRYYDLLVVMRTVNILEAKMAGARRVLRIFMSADEVAHRPRTLSTDDRRIFSSDVAFVGTWMPERGPFLKELIERNVPLAIWGDRWHKAPQWKALRPFWRGPALYDDDSYAKAIQAAKVNLGLLSKGNRDLHTRRSMEIPALGGLLCAERTVEHQTLYKENVEAVFWSNAEECAAKSLALLADRERRNAIANAGQTRIRHNRNFNETAVKTIIATAING
jgi:spore maturation protein CgeB